MNSLIQPGEVFQLKEYVSYKEGMVDKQILAKTEGSRLVIMALAEDVTLAEHTACGNAILFVLEGEGTITYEGQEYVIHEGENFYFPQGQMHSVKANKDLKLALVVVIEEEEK